MSARAFAGHELAARAWYYLSRFPEERSLAAKLFLDTECACPPEDLRLDVVAELAREGYHAKAITERIVRDRARRISGEAPDLETKARVDALVAGVASALRMRAPSFAERAAAAVAQARAERDARARR